MGNFRYFVVGLVLLFASQMALAQLESVVDQGVGPAWLAPGDTEVTQEVVLTDSDAPQTASVTVTRVQVENVIGTAVASDFAKIEILINGEKRGEVNQPFTFPVWIDITDFEIPDDRSATLEVRVTVSSGIIGHRTIQTRVTIEHREEGETYYATRDDLTPTTINNPPVLTGVPETVTVNERVLYTFDADATDRDNDPLTFSLVGAPPGASIDPSTGVFSWTPTEAQGPGTYNFTVRVSDGLTDTDASITITVNEVNVAPVLTGVPATATIDELALYTFDADATDADIPVQTLTFSLVGAPPGASIDPSTGVFSWTPTEAQGPGVYQFTVKVSDGITDTDASITITVNEVNEPPVAVNDTYATNEDTQLNVLNVNGVLVNDTDPDLPAQVLTAVLVTPPANASAFTLNPDGSFTYTPRGDFYGQDTFTYLARDNGTPPADSNVATVTITVNPVPFTALRTPPVGWNLCSAPLKPIPPNDTPAAVIGDDISPLFIYWWDPNATPPGYITPSSLDPGRGYWVYIMTEGITVDVTGTRIDHDYQVPLGKAGWHMISTPTVNVYWGYCKFTDGTDTKTYDEAIEAGWIAPFLYQWDPYTNAYKSFTAQGVIEPWVGYWIRTYHDGLTLILPVEQAIKNPPPPPSSSNLGPSAAELGLTPPAPPTLPMMDKKTGLVVLNYPNPVRDVRTTKFMVLGAEVETIRVSVYDLTGRLVWRGEGAGNELTWHTDDLSGQFLANGVYLYIVEVKVGGQWIRSEVKRLVILR